MLISDWSSDVCSSDLPFDMFGAVLGQADRLRLFVLFVIILAELVDDLVDADIKLGLVVGGARDDERGARLVDQDRIDLVDDAEVEGAMDHLHPLELHIVAQIIEAKLVIGRISDVAVIGFAGSEEQTSDFQSLMRISY